MPEAFADLGWAWITVVSGAWLIAIMLKHLLMIKRRRRTWIPAEATMGKVRTRQASASGADGVRSTRSCAQAMSDVSS